MFFDVTLISVLLVTGYLGPQVLRQLGPGQRTYGVMLILDLGLAIYALAARRSAPDDPVANLIGAISIGGMVCLVFVPPLLRDLSRRALVGNRPRLARVACELRELLQPGMGAKEESEFIDILIATRTGREDQAIERLFTARKEIEDPLARRRLDERIVLTFLYARRWKDAIGHYEAHLGAMDGPTSTQLLVEMVRAYGEEGALDSAAELMEVLESSSLAEEPVFSGLINRARLMFLAYVGRTTAVEGMIGAGGALEAMPQAARSFWSGLARLNAGDRAGARGQLEEAARLSAPDPRAQAYAEQLLTVLDQDGALGPHSVPNRVAELADQVGERAAKAGQRRADKAPSLRGVQLRAVPATLALIALNFVAAAWVWYAYRSPGDIGALVAAGANVKHAVLQGEYWRLSSSMFLHVGWAHLLLNMYGLWVLGKLVEQFLGTTRFFVVALVSGLGGGVASTLLGGAATSAGASGLVFGLLGAAIYELWVHKAAYARPWRRALLGNLVFLAGAMVVIGVVYTAIDQAAHLGGLCAGALFAMLLSPKARWGASLVAGALAAVLAVAGTGFLAYGAWGMVTQSYADTLSRAPTAERTLDGLSFVVPASWEEDDGAFTDPGFPVFFTVARAPRSVSLEEALEAAVLATHHGGARRVGFDRAEVAQASRFVVPPPWRSDELSAIADGVGGRHQYRALVFAREGEGEHWIGTLYCPEALVSDFQPTLSAILESVDRAK